MILYLLAPLLIAGIKSQTVNLTVEDRSGAVGNQTFGVSTNENLTSILSADKGTLIEDELKRHNQTSTLITEDDETFQGQSSIIPGTCQQNILVPAIQYHCEATFHRAMVSMGSESWCHLESVISLYNDFTYCLEEVCHSLSCYYPNPDTQNIFLSIHSQYFQSCSKEEEVVFEDAPQWVVIVLTLVPVSLIPVLVYLVVWKSKVQE